MASNAVLSEQRIGAPMSVSRAQLAIDKAIHTRPRVATKAEHDQRVLDLGLRAGVKVNYSSSRSNEEPLSLYKAAGVIREIELLPQGWDSYGGLALDDRSVEPALELVIAGLQRCQEPTILLRPNGGLGLRWKKGDCELEIDINPDGSCGGIFEDDASGEAVEVDQAASVSDVMPLLHKICQVV